MLKDNIHEGFSFNFGSNPKESQTATFLKTATSPNFPFLHIKIKKDESKMDTNLEVAVNPKLYELIKSTSFTDEIFIHTSNGGQFGHWEYDMIVAMNILKKLNSFESFDNWIKNSRECLAKLIVGDKYKAEFNLQSAKKNTEKLLHSINILDEVNSKDMIFQAAKETVNEKIMDLTTMIYRLAMAIYHSIRGGETSIIKAIDNPGDYYLLLTKSQFYNEHKEEFKEMDELPMELRINVIKVLIAFTVATYVYYRGDLNE